MGATASSGGAPTGTTTTTLLPKRGKVSACSSYSGVPGTLRHDPELLGSPEAGWRRRIAAAEVERGYLARANLKRTKGQVSIPGGLGAHWRSRRGWSVAGGARRRGPAMSRSGHRRQQPGEKQGASEWCSELDEGPGKLTAERVATRERRRRTDGENGSGGEVRFSGDWAREERKGGHREVLGGL